MRQRKTPDAAVKRGLLGSALELIRFPVMNIEEFAIGPAQVILFCLLFSHLALE